MEDRVPNVLPPTPPVTCVPPGVVGAPLITSISGTIEISKEEARAAACDRVQGLGAFFDYQRDAAIYVRRLVLTLPSATSGKRSRDYAKTRDHVTICGSVFGTTLGSLCAYLEGRGIPAERSHVLRAVRTQLLPVAEALQTVRGADAQFLSRGLASCRVAKAQQLVIPEAMARIDSKYGNPYTCIGATAALLTCFGVMAAVPDHAAHLGRDNSLYKALRCALTNLENWKASRINMASDAWLTLAAERRALERAARAAQRAAYVWQEKPPADLLARQLEWARLAAFPAYTLVNEFSQSTILQSIDTQSFFRNTTQPVLQGTMCAPHVSETVPLSQIPLGRLPGQGRKKDPDASASDAGSSSWATLSSNASSAYSCVSHASLDSEFVCQFEGLTR